jgi:hypothetical protein
MRRNTRRKEDTTMSTSTKKTKRRNAGPRRRRFLPPLPNPPDWKTTAASALGGGGSALVGGWLANRGWDPQMVGIAMTAGGVVGALSLPGPWRVAANGMAAAGAGQLALATMHKQAVHQVQQALNTGDKPANAAFPPGVNDAFIRRQRMLARTIDDEERLTDPEFDMDAA